MVQEITIATAARHGTSITIEHAILHHLDPDGRGMGEQLVDTELDFTGKHGLVVRDRLEAFVLRSYEGSRTTATSLEDISSDNELTTLGICWELLSDSSDFVKASWELAGRLTRAMRTRFNCRRRSVPGGRARPPWTDGRNTQT